MWCQPRASSSPLVGMARMTKDGFHEECELRCFLTYLLVLCVLPAFADEMFQMDGGTLRKLKGGESPEGVGASSSFKPLSKTGVSPKPPGAPLGSPL